MPATDATSLLAAGKCYACYGATTFETLKLALLATISQQNNPANPVDPATLIALGKCFPCYSADMPLPTLMMLVLLAQIASGSPTPVI